MGGDAGVVPHTAGHVDCPACELNRLEAQTESVAVLDDTARYGLHLKVCDRCWRAKFSWLMCETGRALQRKARL